MQQQPPGALPPLNPKKERLVEQRRTGAYSLSGNKLNTHDCCFLEARIGIS
ncbi:hypothetical protein [Microcoleus sp. N3A4]|uniref:hypothetical protein n=1 Tax=Microcoleus sp. N3A4 TaxID=3055379 RepID=UPI002FCF1DD3